MAFKLICFVFLFISVGAEIKDFAMPTYSSALSKVLISYSDHMMRISPVVNFMQVSEPNHTIHQHSIMNEVLYTASRNGGIFRVILDVEILAKFSTKLKNRKRFNSIVFVDSLESFYKFYDQINLDHWDYSGNIVVAVTLHLEDIYEVMMKIFEAFWSKHIVNVVVMFMPHASNYEVLLYTYYPFSAFYCERAVPVQLNQYRGNKFLNDIVYFPRKLDNFYGCQVSVVTFKNPPFMMYTQDERGLVYVDGIDGIVLRVLAQQLNFNVTIYVNNEAWGNVHKNGTVTGEKREVVGFFVNYVMFKIKLYGYPCNFLSMTEVLSQIFNLVVPPLSVT